MLTSAMALLGAHSRSPEAVLEKRRVDALLEQIEALAAELEPAFAEAVLSYLSALSDAATLEAIVEALKAGNLYAVLELLADAKTAAAAVAVEDAIRDTLWAGGLLAASRIRFQPTAVAFHFDRLNPELIRWLRSYRLDLIQKIDAQTKEAVRDVLVRGMQKGENPIAVARQVKTVVGLLPKQAAAVDNFRKQLETWHLRSSAKGWGIGNKIAQVNGHTVSILDEDGLNKDGIQERRLRDRRFDKTLAKYLGSGKPIPPELIDKMVEAYRKRYLQHRARTIARTEALRTTNKGVEAAWKQAIEDGKVPSSLVRKEWIVAKDERLCEVCSSVPGMNPKRGVPLSQPFQTMNGPVSIPPLHPNCRCTIFVRVWEPEQLAEEANAA